MKKFIFAFAMLSSFTLYAAQSPRFHHQTSITSTKSDGKPTEYLARIKIDKIVDDKSPPVEYSAPQLLCLQGQEAVVVQKADGDSYIVKCLVYKSENKMRARTAIIILENDENPFTSIEEFEITE